MSELQRTMCKSCRTISTVAQVLIICIYVALGICALSLVLLLIFGGDVNVGAAVLTSGISIGGEPVRTPEELMGLIPTLAHGVATALIALRIMYAVRRVFAGIAESGVPFTERVALKIRSLGVMLVLLSVVPYAAQSVAAMCVKVPGPESFVDMGLVLAALVVFCLAYIFRYGARLQQQVDETL